MPHKSKACESDIALPPRWRPGKREVTQREIEALPAEEFLGDDTWGDEEEVDGNFDEADVRDDDEVRRAVAVPSFYCWLQSC